MQTYTNQGELLIDNSTTDFPKELQIRNTSDGVIWQQYVVNNLDEAKLLARSAKRNAFYSRTLNNIHADSISNQTFPDWRDDKRWKDYWDNRERYLIELE